MLIRDWGRALCYVLQPSVGDGAGRCGPEEYQVVPALSPHSLTAPSSLALSHNEVPALSPHSHRDPALSPHSQGGLSTEPLLTLRSQHWALTYTEVPALSSPDGLYATVSLYVHVSDGERLLTAASLDQWTFHPVLGEYISPGHICHLWLSIFR